MVFIGDRWAGWFLEGKREKGWRLKEREGESIVFRGERVRKYGVYRGRERKDGV